MEVKTWMLRIANGVLYLAACVLAGTGLALELRLEEDQAQTLWGWSQDTWSEVHLAVALTFVALTVLHLVLNWNWIANLLKGPRRWAVATIGVFGLALAAAILLAPTAGSGAPEGGHPERLHEAHHE
jgi:hypothetical protein